MKTLLADRDQSEAATSSSSSSSRYPDVCIVAEALEENIFEWHFAINGQRGSDYEGGIYHGRILLPPEYPFKPPDFVMLTPSGRFQVGKRICLSISQHHPEHWQPSWSVRTALTALIAFMPTPGEGALGSLDFTQEEKERLARQSRGPAPTFGSAARQEVSRRVHEKMLLLVPPRNGGRSERDADGGPSANADVSASASQQQQAGAAPATPVGESGGGGSGSGGAGVGSKNKALEQGRAREPARAMAPPPAEGGDIFWTTLLWMLVALATCAMLKKVVEAFM
uniref:UBC core domain-containing protein n=1 Tax=Phaeocystis cordata TaxID=118079 RepID=A0A7S1HPV4_9EUKA